MMSLFLPSIYLNQFSSLNKDESSTAFFVLLPFAFHHVLGQTPAVGLLPRPLFSEPFHAHSLVNVLIHLPGVVVSLTFLETVALGVTFDLAFYSHLVIL